MKCKFEGKWRDMKFSGTVEQLLAKLKLNSEIIVVKINDDIATEKDEIKNSDSVEVLKVVSGG
ncbi:MoaD/ThiS family protein [Candidatus Micrarchaeota archaeon]|nr:MoaD/ThiS family protein [Candidatus Micrarchaeota archaeon]